MQVQRKFREADYHTHYQRGFILTSIDEDSPSLRIFQRIWTSGTQKFTKEDFQKYSE